MQIQAVRINETIVNGYMGKEKYNNMVLKQIGSVIESGPSWLCQR